MSHAAEARGSLPYFKLSGGGNDFVALVEPAEDPSSDLVRALCRRGLSVGADGLFVLRRAGASVRMDYFNPDGRPAELCLNGARCAVRLASRLGWAEDELLLETGAGQLRGWSLGEAETEVEVSTPNAPTRVTLFHDDAPLEGWSVRVGVPHFVLSWRESLASAPVAELGPALRSDPVFGDEGSNVNFVRFTGDDSFEIRSFERGVEAETLACGTGVLAAAAVGRLLSRTKLPAGALTRGGFVLRVTEGGRPGTWTLAGDARILARGELEPGARRLPAPPAWS